MDFSEDQIDRLRQGVLREFNEAARAIRLMSFCERLVIEVDWPDMTTRSKLENGRRKHNQANPSQVARQKT